MERIVRSYYGEAVKEVADVSETFWNRFCPPCYRYPLAARVWSDQAYDTYAQPRRGHRTLTLVGEDHICAPVEVSLSVQPDRMQEKLTVERRTSVECAYPSLYP